jgi:hypothetical protein
MESCKKIERWMRSMLLDFESSILTPFQLPVVAAAVVVVVVATVLWFVEEESAVRV